jgi:hypothetical protein
VLSWGRRVRCATDAGPPPRTPRNRASASVALGAKTNGAARQETRRIAKRLADQLEQRGRSARSADWLGLIRLRGEPLLRALAALPDAADLILVTGGDDLPGEHGPRVNALRITVATIDGRRAAEWPREG